MLLWWVVLLLLIVTVVQGVAASSAFAVTVEQHPDEVTGQVTISPTKYELQMKPGESASSEIRVSNRTGKAQTITFSVEDFEGSSDPSQATVFMGQEDSTWGARQWLKPEIKSIVLDQGETAVVKTAIDVPSGAEPGGHYAVVFASTSMEAVDEQGSAINITSRVGCLFLITVAGNIVEEGNLSSIESPGFIEYGPVDFGLVFNDTGNVHLKPSGRIVITNLLGQTVAEIPVKEWVVLPDASRRNLVTWDQHYMLGRYTVRAEIDYGSEGQRVIVSQSFWAIPWRILAAVLAGLVILVVIVSLLIRRKRRRSRAHEKELDHLRAAVAGQGQEASPVAEGIRPSEPAVAGMVPRLTPLNVLLPSTEDARVVDLNDPETQKLVKELIDGELDLARMYIGDGRIDDARRELLEAKNAAQMMGLYSEVGLIDDMLGHL